MVYALYAPSSLHEVQRNTLKKRKEVGRRNIKNCKRKKKTKETEEEIQDKKKKKKGEKRGIKHGVGRGGGKIFTS